MASRADVVAYQRAASNLVALAVRDLAWFWGGLDLTNPAATRDSLLEFFELIGDTYGAAAGSMAAEWWEELRDKAGASGVSRAVIADLDDITARAQGRVRFGARHLWTGDPDATRSFANGVADWMVKQVGRETVDLSTGADRARPRWARVPTGAVTCAFCVMLASRGPVYRSERTAGGDGIRFHADCDCVATPMWDETDLPAGYDPDRLYQMYRDADGGGTSQVLARMRELHGLT